MVGNSSISTAAPVSSAEADEEAYVRGLYDGIATAPRATFVRKFTSIDKATDSMSPTSADDASLLLHLGHLNELLLQYLKPSEYEIAPVPAPVAGASATATAAAVAMCTALPVAAPGVMAPARVPSLIAHNPEFTAYFLDNALPAVVRNLLAKHFNAFSSGRHMRGLPPLNAAPAVGATPTEMALRVNAFLQTVLRVIAKHLSEPTVPLMLLLPAPAPAAAAASAPSATVPAGASASSAGADAAAAPRFVPTKVGPLFPDSVSSNLIGTLQRIFDDKKPLYATHDKPAIVGVQTVQGFEQLLAARKHAAPAAVKENIAGEGEPEGIVTAAATPAAASAVASADENLSEANDDESFMAALTIEQEQAARLLGDSALKAQFAVGLDEQLSALAASRRDYLAQRERARDDRLRAKLTQLQAEHKPFIQPVYQYSAVAPGQPAFGMLQSNVQCYGMHGGFAVMLERLSVGFNTRIDSRIPVAARRGHNPAQGSREPFYQHERARRVAHARKRLGENATPEQISAEIDPPIIQGSFPSIAPYLTKASFVSVPVGGVTRIPLHRGRTMLDPLLKLVQSNMLSNAFYSQLCAQVKDVMIIRLLHLQADESRLCDKEFLTNLLQEYVWRFIKHLSVHYQNGSWEAIKWPMLENQSMIEYQQLAIDEHKAAAEQKEEKQPEPAPAAPVPALLSTPPPALFELNLNADELMEAITIKLSYHLFISPLLEKRINGLQDLNRFVELTNVRQRLDAAIAAGRPEISRAGKVAVTAWLNQTVLSNYLLDIRILDDIAGPYPQSQSPDAPVVATHPQLIQRSDEVVRYLSKLNKLQDDHLRQIWAASIGKHESVEQAVYSLLASVARTLTFQHVRLLLCECVASVPYSQWNSRTLKLLSELARAHEKDESVSAALAPVAGAERHPADVKNAAEQESVVRIAAGQLWSVLTLPHTAPAEVQSDSASAEAQQATPSSAPSNATARVSFSLRQQCAAQLVTLLSKPSLEPLRREYISTIMASVQARQSAKEAPLNPQASTSSIGLQLWLLSGLLQAYSVSQNALNENPRWKVIQNLTPLSAFISELTSYAAAAKANLPAVLAAVRKRVGPRRRVPDAALLVLTGSPLEPAGDGATLGIGLAELTADSATVLPVCLENSTDLLDSIRHDCAAYAYNSGSGPTGAQTGGAAAASVSTGGAPASRTATVSASSVPYSEAMSHELEVLVRLELLRYLIQASYAQFATADIDGVWRAVGGASALSPRAACQWASWLRWLHVPRCQLSPTWIDAAAAEHEELYMKGKTNYQFTDSSRVTKDMAEDTAKHLFVDRLCKAPEASAETQQQSEEKERESAGEQWAQMDESAFITWRHYFLIVNEQSRNIVLHAPLSVGAFNTYAKHSGELPGVV